MNGCILLVEDNDDIRESLSDLLIYSGYEVILAADGTIAFEELSAHTVNLILLDLRMPLLDGWQFLQATYAILHPHPPVIILSATVQAKNIEMPPAVVGYLLKPFDTNVLMNLIRKHICVDGTAE